jgi:hypothetical protein
VAISSKNAGNALAIVAVYADALLRALGKRILSIAEFCLTFAVSKDRARESPLVANHQYASQ